MRMSAALFSCGYSDTEDPDVHMASHDAGLTECGWKRGESAHGKSENRGEFLISFSGLSAISNQRSPLMPSLQANA
jgi:hypothetical protein